MEQHEGELGLECLYTLKAEPGLCPSAQRQNEYKALLLQGEPMRIIYRMRGLLGDATEEFIESLDSTTGNAFVC